MKSEILFLAFPMVAGTGGGQIIKAESGDEGLADRGCQQMEGKGRSCGF
jgi:hypothetical protein